MSRQIRYSHIYNVQRMILLVFYTTTCIALSIPLFKLVLSLWPNDLFPLIATLLLYLIVTVVIGSLIHVISFIPFNLAASFDPIKNEIASGRIQTMEELGKSLTTFTVDFFNFSFLDIPYAYIQTVDSDLISHEEVPDVEKVLKGYQMLEKSKHFEEVTLAGEITTPQGKYLLYILPIWFGEQWLGYMALLTEKRISRFFQRFLNEFENNFLDDQVMLILNQRKR